MLGKSVFRKREEGEGGLVGEVAGIWVIGEKVPIGGGFWEKRGIWDKVRFYGNLGLGEMAPFQGLGRDDPLFAGVSRCDWIIRQSFYDFLRRLTVPMGRRYTTEYGNGVQSEF